MIIHEFDFSGCPSPQKYFNNNFLNYGTCILSCEQNLNQYVLLESLDILGDLIHKYGGQVENITATPTPWLNTPIT